MRRYTNLISDSILAEFPHLTRENIFDILKEYYQIDCASNIISNLIYTDAQRNFTNRSELIARIVRKHLGQPEHDLILYPENKIDHEIEKRIRNIMKLRLVNSHYTVRTYNGIRKEICRVALSFSKQVSKKDIDKEIEERIKLTGLTREQVERRLCCAYFGIGIKDSERIAIEA